MCVAPAAHSTAAAYSLSPSLQTGIARLLLCTGNLRDEMYFHAMEIHFCSFSPD